MASGSIIDGLDELDGLDGLEEREGLDKVDELDKLDGLDELCRVVKPGGHIVFSLARIYLGE